MALRVWLLWLLLFLGGCLSTPLDHARGHITRKHLGDSGTVVVYHVRRGDTLYSIARRIGIDYRLLAKRNHLRPPYTIFPGQELYIGTMAPQKKPRRSTHRRRRHGHAAGSREGHKREVAAAGQGKRVRLTHQRLLWPVRGKITSPFGRRGSRMHDGIDISAPQGTPIHAAAAGKVVYSDHRLSGYGNLVIIRHQGDLFTVYAHNQRNLVRKGDRVRAGDIIARVGATGRASGPHLHFEVRIGSTPVDPLAYLPH